MIWCLCLRQTQPCSSILAYPRGILGLIAVCLVFLGCSTPSKIRKINPCDPNSAAIESHYEGQAATEIAKAEAKNLLSVQGRIADMEKYNAKAYIGLIGMCVLGLIFWGFTRSKMGWVIPVSAIIGIIVMRSFTEYGQYVQWAAFGIGGLLLIWKARQYQKERNENGR